MEGFLDEAGTTHMRQLEALDRVFEKAAEADTASEVSTCFPFTPFTFFLFLSRRVVMMVKISGARLSML